MPAFREQKEPIIRVDDGLHAGLEAGTCRRIQCTNRSRSAAGWRRGRGFVLLEILGGYTLRLGEPTLDDFVEGLADFLAVLRSRPSWILFQELPELRIAPCLRMDLAPVLVRWCTH